MGDFTYNQATNVGTQPSLCSNPAAFTGNEVDPGIPPVATGFLN